LYRIDIVSKKINIWLSLKEGENFNMDDFARRFGGLTRKQYIELAYEIFKK
jgi:hypothetical protein